MIKKQRNSLRRGAVSPSFLSRIISRFEYTVNNQFDLILIFIFILWLLPIFIYPFLNLRIIHFFHSYTCHQMSSRCYHLNNTPLPVCSRCLGVYTGALIASIIVYLFDIKKSLKIHYFILFIILIFLQMRMERIIDLENYYIHIRAITGILAGGSFILFFAPIMKRK